MERTLTFWIDDKTQRNMLLSRGIIMERARMSYLEFFSTRKTSKPLVLLLAEAGLKKLIKRANIHSICFSEEIEYAGKNK